MDARGIPFRQVRQNPVLWAAAAAGAAVGVWALRRKRESFRDSVVLITGGSRGLGLVLARRFAAEGARVAICARDAVELERARRDLEGRGAQVLVLGCDVTDLQQVNRMVDAVYKKFGPVDVLVNNAGVIQVGPESTMTLEDYRESLDTHFWASLYTTREVLPGMRRRGRGRIVNISSIGGKIGVPHLAPYSAGKFALAGFSEALRAELRQDGIWVTTVYPGLMRTGSPRNAVFKGRHRSEYAWFHISDGLPGLSMNAERAARRIISACRAGRAEAVLSWPAKAAARLHGVAPRLVLKGLSVLNRFLPRPGGIGRQRRRGTESVSAFSPSILTALSNRAAQRNNEVL